MMPVTVDTTTKPSGGFQQQGVMASSYVTSVAPLMPCVAQCGTTLNFDQIDTNHDGVISREEFSNMLNAQGGYTVSAGTATVSTPPITVAPATYTVGMPQYAGATLTPSMILPQCTPVMTHVSTATSAASGTLGASTVVTRSSTSAMSLMNSSPQYTMSTISTPAQAVAGTLPPVKVYISSQQQKSPTVTPTSNTVPAITGAALSPPSHDGVPSPPAAAVGGGDVFDQLDVNHDGVLSREEFSALGKSGGLLAPSVVDCGPSPVAGVLESAPPVHPNESGVTVEVGYPAQMNVRVASLPATVSTPAMTTAPVPTLTTGTTAAATPATHTTPGMQSVLTASTRGGTPSLGSIYAAHSPVGQMVQHSSTTPPMVTAMPSNGASFVAPPGMMPSVPQPTVQFVPQPFGHIPPNNQGGFLEEPCLPQALTEGIPDTNSIEEQRLAYVNNLDMQLAQGTMMLEEQMLAQKRLFIQEAEQLKAQFYMQADQAHMMQTMSLEQECEQDILELQRRRTEKGVLLEQQANAALLDFKQRKAQEDFEFQQYECRKRLLEDQMRVHHETEHRQFYPMQRHDVNPHQHPYPEVNIFDQMCASRDGSITCDEHSRRTAGVMDLFDQIDTNHDGRISREEFAIALHSVDQVRHGDGSPYGRHGRDYMMGSYHDGPNPSPVQATPIGAHSHFASSSTLGNVQATHHNSSSSTLAFPATSSYAPVPTGYGSSYAVPPTAYGMPLPTSSYGAPSLSVAALGAMTGRNEVPTVHGLQTLTPDKHLCTVK